MSRLNLTDAGFLAADLVGASDDEVVLGSKDDIAIFAHDFDIEMPEGRFPGAFGKLKIEDSLPGGDLGDGSEGQTAQLMSQLLAEGKSIDTPGRRLADTNSGSLGVPGDVQPAPFFEGAEGQGYGKAIALNYLFEAGGEPLGLNFRTGGGEGGIVNGLHD